MPLHFKKMMASFMILAIVGIGIFSFNKVGAGNTAKLSEEKPTVATDEIITTLEKMGINNASVGYDEKGNIVVWINSKTLSGYEEKEFHFSKPVEGYYQAFIAKKVFEKIPNIHAIWVYQDADIYNFFTYVTFETFKNNGLSKASPDPQKFYKTVGPFNKLVDIFWSPQNLGDDTDYDYDYTMLENGFKKIFESRLKKIQYGDPDSESRAVYLSIDGYPKSEEVIKDLNVEVAKAFVLSVGRYETQHWNGIGWTSITYASNNKKLLEAGMDTHYRFQKWFDSGLSPYDWAKFCELKIEDPNLNLTNPIQGSFKLNTPDKLTYQQVREDMMSMSDMEIELLGAGSNGISAVIRINGSSREEIWAKQLKKAEILMKLPLSSIWFISETPYENILAFIDRRKYNILTYMNQDGSFDILPSDWPKMAAKYWELIK